MQITSDAKIEILKDSEERPLLVLESRRKTALAFGVVMVVGLVACTSYLVGRRLAGSAPAPAPQLAAVPVRASRPAPKPAPPVAQAAVAAVQLPAIQAPAPVVQAPPPAIAQSAPMPVQPAAAASATAAVAITPVKGQNFIQVGFLTPDTVEPFLDRLKAAGFQGKMAPGDDKRTVRVMVGPLKNSDVMTVSAELTKAGFANFPKYF